MQGLPPALCRRRALQQGESPARAVWTIDAAHVRLCPTLSAVDEMSENTGPGFDTSVQDRPEEEVREPEMYRVVLHNDDYTTMEFVVEVLVRVFRKDIIAATRIMLDVHRKGRGLVGTYTYDIATTKAEQVHQLAREREFPLRCTVERA